MSRFPGVRSLRNLFSNDVDGRPQQVSVCIPTWRSQPFMARTLDFALGQTYPHTRVLVSVDQCEDGTAAICEAYARTDPRLQVFVQPERLGWARNVNLLIGNERARSERYMLTLDNLAHSLKTPLAAVRSVINEHPESDLKKRVETQVDRMNDIVRYQLRKPASYASEGFGLTAVAVEKELKRLVEGLLKVYKDKSPDIVIDVAHGAVFRGDRGDLLRSPKNVKPRIFLATL